MMVSQLGTLLLIVAKCHPLQALAPSTGTCQQSTSSPQCTTGDSSPSPLIEASRLRETIASGRVYQQENFLTEEEVQTLLYDIERLAEDGTMVPSGLSNTNKGKDQNFGKNDRMVCPIPWWVDSLDGKPITLEKSHPHTTNSDANSTSINEQILNDVSQRIQELRLQVSAALDRPSMSESGHAHECYYSKSSEGASLARHLDEFHEETKGPRGWLLPSRRSISWLIYLSDEDWDVSVNGGELRSFPQKQVRVKPKSFKVGSNDGNLQVGWLDIMNSDSTLPVYLNSWYKPPGENDDVVDPHCVLYVVKDDDKKEYITKPWINSMENPLSDFMKAQTKVRGPNIFMNENFAKGFKLIEDRETWVNGAPPPGSDVVDISPIRGSIVMFDSVSLPHEVLFVKRGTRSAAAGWFHEQTQPIPESFY